MTSSSSAVINPIAQFLSNHRSEDQTPIPLRSTTFDILVEAGLAIVTTTRLFENNEASTIEATLTFPVPVHAVLFSLEVKIGDRRLSATASAKDEAREIYEEGLSRGKSAILHEELLRGIHMLSVGHIPPGETIEVTTIWTMPVAIAGGEAHLRIPTTVGQLYGNSGLADGDDFTWTSAATMAQVSVRSPDADIKLQGKSLRNATTQVPMNHPIDLVVGNWEPRAICGRTSEGKSLELLIQAAETSTSPLDIAIIVDHSGSMGGPEDPLFQRLAGPTKHNRVVRALTALSSALGPQDNIDLWEFASVSNHVGSAGPRGKRRGFGLVKKSLASLARTLTKPNGGTEIGRALDDVIAQSVASSILLVTDGKSHAVDVHRLAGKGKRICVLLIGADSLEANVGHLAILTGGDIFVASKERVDAVFAAAVDSLRGPVSSATAPQGSSLSHSTYTISGSSVRFTEVPGDVTWERNQLEQAVGALGAMLIMPHMTAEEAKAKALAEGLVTHLTSLVLVDETGAIQENLPTRRRVPLESVSCQLASVDQFEIPAFLRRSSPSEKWTISASIAPLSGFNEHTRKRMQSPDAKNQSTAMDHIEELAVLINWDEVANDLSKGVLDRLDRATVARITKLSKLPQVQKFAASSNVESIRVIVALLALAGTENSTRSAMRVATALDRLIDTTALQRLREDLQTEAFSVDVA